MTPLSSARQKFLKLYKAKQKVTQKNLLIVFGWVGGISLKRIYTLPLPNTLHYPAITHYPNKWRISAITHYPAITQGITQNYPLPSKYPFWVILGNLGNGGAITHFGIVTIMLPYLFRTIDLALFQPILWGYRTSKRGRF